MDKLTTSSFKEAEGLNAGNNFHFDHPSPSVWEVEKFDYLSHFGWMYSNWALCFLSCGVYMALVFLGRVWMGGRERFGLKRPLVLWNGSLALFSALGFLRMWGDVWGEWTLQGKTSRAVVLGSVCTWHYRSITTLFWGYLFTLSKVLEFGDTAFIVLRKQKLILLHWYHHITVCLYTWLTIHTYDPSTRFFGTMNFFVHSVMYSYYALRALGYKIPSRLAMAITTLQLAQMVVGLAINLYSLYVIKVVGDPCDRPLPNVIGGIAMYASYFALFLDFFIKSYRRKGVILKSKSKTL